MRRLIGLMLALAMVVGMLPMTVLAAPEDRGPNTVAVWVGGVQMENDRYLPAGSDTLTRHRPRDGGYAHYENGVLILHDYEYEGEGYAYPSTDSLPVTGNSAAVYSEVALRILLEGSNSLKLTASEGEAITQNVDGAELRLESRENGELHLQAPSGISVDLGSVRFDSGTMTITAEQGIGVNTSTGVTINGGSVTIEAEQNGLWGREMHIGACSLDVKSLNTEEDDRYCAIWCQELSLDSDGMVLQASMEPDGALGSYTADSLASYDRIVAAEADVSIDGIGLMDRDYLATGADAVTNVQPESGGYAYYEDGVPLVLIALDGFADFHRHVSVFSVILNHCFPPSRLNRPVRRSLCIRP